MHETYFRHQGTLERVLESIFPLHRVRSEARKETSIINPSTGKYFEVDVWIHELHLCFEFQDEYHYDDSKWYNVFPSSSIQERDYTKRTSLLGRGDTLIVVPCWWDGSESSLKSTIHFKRPDLLMQDYSATIPSNPHLDFFTGTSLMLATFPQSTQQWTRDQTQWWIGEKYDGMRCYWAAAINQLCSRHGNVFDAYASLPKLLGDFGLDGELWLGRGSFAECQSLLFHSRLEKQKWPWLRIVCFDTSPSTMRSQFEMRYHCVLEHYPAEHPVVIVAPRFFTNQPQLIKQTLQHVVSTGGEGIILQKPHSYYEPGRSYDLFKLKEDSRGEQEALVVDVEGDGSLVLQSSVGVVFVVPKSRCILHRRAIRGDVVTFTFSPGGTASSLPHVFRIRDDVMWEDISNRFVNSQIAKPMGYWTSNHARQQLEHFAKLNGFDPLVAENWYNISRAEIMHHPEGRIILRHYGNSLIKALVSLFPEVTFQISKFAAMPLHYWSNSHKRKALEAYARLKGFDPLVAENWYNTRPADMKHLKEVWGAVRSNHRHKTLVEVFPEVTFQISKFTTVPHNYWNKNRKREVLERYAQESGFDPLVAENWYKISGIDIHQHKEVRAVLAQYEKSLVSALVDLFPEVSLQIFKFGTAPHNYWNKSNRREALERYARSKGFDPLIAENWYHVRRADVLQHKEGRMALTQYSSS